MQRTVRGGEIVDITLHPDEPAITESNGGRIHLI